MTIDVGIGAIVVTVLVAFEVVPLIIVEFEEDVVVVFAVVVVDIDVVVVALSIVDVVENVVEVDVGVNVVDVGVNVVAVVEPLLLPKKW